MQFPLSIGTNDIKSRVITGQNKEFHHAIRSAPTRTVTPATKELNVGMIEVRAAPLLLPPVAPFAVAAPARADAVVEAA